MKWLIGLFFSTLAMIGHAKEVPTSIKAEYALQMHQAFEWQAVGKSTLAMACFENAFDRAVKEGECFKKLAPIRQMFFWYRTYGRYLGLMDPSTDPHDRIYGEYGGIPYTRFMPASFSNSSSEQMAVKKARQREYIAGVSELIGGLIGVIYLPHAGGKAFAGSVAWDGVSRIWKVYQETRIEKDVATLGLQQITNMLNDTSCD